MEKKTFLFRILFPALCLMVLGTSCVNRGNLTFGPDLGETYTVGGKISLSNPVEGDLLLAIRPMAADITTLTDYSKFVATASGSRGAVKKDGSYTLPKVPYSETMMLSATAGKIVLKRRLYPRDLRLTDTTQLNIDLDSTARAIIWEKAHERGTELTEADISAREYVDLVASVSFAIKMAMIMPKKSVPKTILDLEMVTKAAQTAADTIEAREKTLVEAHSVLQNILMEENLTVLSHYVSPDFTNDFDSSSNYNDFLDVMKTYFKTYNIKVASYTVLQMEFLPGSQARIRTAGQFFFNNYFSGLDGFTPVYISDVLWRREGAFWKIIRNLPYKAGHPTQVGADARWGEIARAHADLQNAIITENIETMIKYISPAFRNDWDIHSTYSDLLRTAKERFDACDVKVASYTLNSIDLVNNELAKVRCSAQVRVINLKTGLDIDSGVVNAVIEWHREEGVWKLYRNLPYRFAHPKNILKSVLSLIDF